MTEGEPVMGGHEGKRGRGQPRYRGVPFPFFQEFQKSNPAAELDIVVFEPKVYEDSLQISYRLRNGSPVIVNLKYLDPEDGTRLIDFICGRLMP